MNKIDAVRGLQIVLAVILLAAFSLDPLANIPSKILTFIFLIGSIELCIRCFVGLEVAVQSKENEKETVI